MKSQHGLHAYKYATRINQLLISQTNKQKNHLQCQRPLHVQSVFYVYTVFFSFLCLCITAAVPLVCLCQYICKLWAVSSEAVPSRWHRRWDWSLKFEFVCRSALRIKHCNSLVLTFVNSKDVFYTCAEAGWLQRITKHDANLEQIADSCGGHLGFHNKLIIPNWKWSEYKELSIFYRSMLTRVGFFVMLRYNNEKQSFLYIVPSVCMWNLAFKSSIRLKTTD